MWGQSKQASSAKTALAYLTIGALTTVWTIIYFLYLRRIEASDTEYLVCAGFFLTGLVLIVIGLGVGYIGRSAMQSEVAPTASVVIPTAAPAVVPEAASPRVLQN